MKVANFTFSRRWAKIADIVLLALDGERGLAFLEKFRERGYAARVLALADDDLDDAAAVAMVRAGASGIFSTRGSPQELVRAIREIGAGGRWLAVRYMDALMRPPGAAREEQPLTERQRRVLSGVTEGLANKQIGVRLGLSESAVKSTLPQLFR